MTSAMSHIDNAPRQAANEITTYSPYCGCSDCDKETAVVFLRVRDAAGKIRVGRFSDFGYVKNQGDQRKLLIRQGYTFMDWVTRCAKCYTEDLDRAGKSILCLPKTEHKYHPQNDEQRIEYIEVIRGVLNKFGSGMFQEAR